MENKLQNSTVELGSVNNMENMVAIAQRQKIIDDFGWQKISETRKSGETVGNIDTYVVPPCDRHQETKNEAIPKFIPSPDFSLLASTVPMTHNTVTGQIVYKHPNPTANNDLRAPSPANLKLLRGIPNPDSVIVPISTQVPTMTQNSTGSHSKKYLENYLAIHHRT